MSKRHLQTLDRDHLIHSVSNFRAHERNGVSVLDRGEGAYLFDLGGNKLLDAFSGLWCVNTGYGQESIVRAAAEQMARLPYATTYFDFGSEPAIQLAAKLADRAPGSLNHVYFTQGGSDSIDSAIRYITHYYNAVGKPQKKQFIALERGYHGTSSIGSGLTGLPAFHKNFDVPLAHQHHLPSPYPYRHECGDDPAALIAASVKSLYDKVEELGTDNVAAFFCEPIQGSGGVIVPPAGWLKAISEACIDLDILLVADEVDLRGHLGEDLEALLRHAIVIQLEDQRVGDAALLGAVQQRDLDLVDGSLSAFELGLRQQHDELLAAVPPDHVDHATAVAHAGRDRFQALVAGEVAGGIVELLEVIDVQDDHGVGTLVTA